MAPVWACQRGPLGIPQPHRQYPIRPSHLFFRYDPPEEESASHVYPPFSLTGGPVGGFFRDGREIAW